MPIAGRENARLTLEQYQIEDAEFGRHCFNGFPLKCLAALQLYRVRRPLNLRLARGINILPLCEPRSSISRLPVFRHCIPLSRGYLINYLISHELDTFSRQRIICPWHVVSVHNSRFVLISKVWNKRNIYTGIKLLIYWKTRWNFSADPISIITRLNHK